MTIFRGREFVIEWPRRPARDKNFRARLAKTPKIAENGSFAFPDRRLGTVSLFPMKITSPTFWKAAGLLGTTFFRNWMATIDFKWAFYEPEIDPAVSTRQFILMFWHEHILCPLIFRRHSNVTMMVSQHGDAEVVNQVARLVGMKCIRGSTFRGGSAAVKQFLKLKEQNILAFTPDGPRGPYRRLASGAVFLASKLEMPVVLLGAGYDRPWRLTSWDRFAIPRPFTRGRIITSPFIRVPKRLNKLDLEHFRLKFETLLTELTELAEKWACSGKPVSGESTVCMGPKCSLSYYGFSRSVETGFPPFH